MIVALHGFLGLPSDWDGILSEDAKKLNLFTKPFQIPKGEIVVGYSLGARLALQHLNAHSWKAAVIISAHSGLNTEEEKEARKAQDERWARRFETEPWDVLMRDWNAQAVFSGHVVQRRKEDYDRRALSDALRKWSLGRQKKIDLSVFDIPILWITGEGDEKLSAHAKALQLSHQKSKIITVPKAGHRVLWEQPIYIQKQIQQFLGEIV